MLATENNFDRAVLVVVVQMCGNQTNKKGTMLEQGLFKSQQASSLTACSAVCFVPPPPPQKGELSAQYNVICCCRQRMEQERNDSHLFKTDHAMLI